MADLKEFSKQEIEERLCRRLAAQVRLREGPLVRSTTYLKEVSPREKTFGDIRAELERLAPLDMDVRALRVLQAAITIRLIELGDKL